MTYSDLAYLWGREDCKLWAVFLNNGREVTDQNSVLNSYFTDDLYDIQSGWLFLEFRHGHKFSWLPQDTYMKVYRIDGSFLWEYK